MHSYKGMLNLYRIRIRISSKLKYFQVMYYNLGPSMDKPFRWILENGLGYVAWLVDNMRNEKVTAAPLSQNRASFKAYAMAFEESRKAID